MAKSPNPRKTSTDIEIKRPTQGTPVTVNPDGKILVEVERLTEDIDKVLVAIRDAGAAEPNDPPDDAVELTLAAQTFSGNVYAGAVPMADPGMDNKFLKAWPYDGEVIGDPALEDFKATAAATVTAKVDARNCIWLTWAPKDYSVPTYGESGCDYRPRTLVVPSDATQAVVTVTSSGKWNHHPPTDAGTGPNGKDDQRPLEKPELYKTAELKSWSIDGSTALNLNLLVGIWDWGSDTATTEIPIGQSATIDWGGGARPEKLQLAFHDGYEWSNNSGTMDVQVVWS